MPNAAQMDPRQRQKERKRRGTTQDRKARGMDYQVLRKGGLEKIGGMEDKRVGGQTEKMGNMGDKWERWIKWIHR